MTLDFYLNNFHNKYIALVEKCKSLSLALAKLIKIYLLYLEILKTKCNQVLNVPYVTNFSLCYFLHIPSLKKVE